MARTPRTRRAPVGQLRGTFRRLLILTTLLGGGTLLGCGGEALPTDPGGDAPKEVEVEVEMQVDRVRFDPVTETPVVILVEKGGARQLPIWIGVAEANSIAAEILEVSLPRPNSHDLTQRLLTGLDAKLERVVVTDLRGGVYFAALHLVTPSGQVEIDSRPSDAIAVGLRAGAPLFVRESLLADEAKKIRSSEEDGRLTL